MAELPYFLLWELLKLENCGCMGSFGAPSLLSGQ